MKLLNREFWAAAAERAVKTGAQFVLVSWGVADGVLNIMTVDPMNAVGMFGGGLAVSLLTSLASAGVNNPGPSLSKSETTTARRKVQQ